MARPKYNVSTPIETGQGGTYWHKVGAGFVNSSGLITIMFNSLPLPDREGKVKVMLFENEDDDKRTERRGPPPRQENPGRSFSEELDDEIPF